MRLAELLEHCVVFLKCSEQRIQGRINRYAKYVVAWGPRARGPRGGKSYF